MKAFFRRLGERLSKYAVYRLARRHAELIRYAVVGLLTTAVSFTVYLVCTDLLFPHLLLKNEPLYAAIFNGVGWGFAVLFAFFANRLFVFRESGDAAPLLPQLLSFYLLRFASGALETLAPSLLILLGTHHLVAKVLVSLAVIVLNYVFAKFVTFARRKSAPLDAKIDL